MYRTYLVLSIIAYTPTCLTCVLVSDALFWASLEPRGGHAAGPVFRRRPHACHPDVGPPLRHIPVKDPGEPHQVGPPHRRSEGFSQQFESL